MKRTLIRIVLSAVILGLAGCASHEGPPRKTVVLAWMQSETGHRHIQQNKFTRAMEKYAHVGKCLPTHAPGVWSCNAWFQRPGKKVYMRDIVKVMDNGGHWSPYQDAN